MDPLLSINVEEIKGSKMRRRKEKRLKNSSKDRAPEKESLLGETCTTCRFYQMGFCSFWSKHKEPSELCSYFRNSGQTVLT